MVAPERGRKKKGGDMNPDFDFDVVNGEDDTWNAEYQLEEDVRIEPG